MAIDPTGISPSDPGPAAAAQDGQSASAYPMEAQIARDRYLKAKAARAVRGGGLIFTKLLPAMAPADQQGNGQSAASFDSPGF